ARSAEIKIVLEYPPARGVHVHKPTPRRDDATGHFVLIGHRRVLHMLVERAARVRDIEDWPPLLGAVERLPAKARGVRGDRRLHGGRNLRTWRKPSLFQGLQLGRQRDMI